MKILIVTATRQELGNIDSVNQLKHNFPDIEFLVTGVGMVKATYSLTSLLHLQRPDFILHTGICGSFRPEIPIGTVVNVLSEEFADIGFDDKGKFIPFHEKGDIDKEGKLICPTDLGNKWGFNSVHGITVNTASGNKPAIDKLVNQFNPDIETMEGAAVFYTCMKQNIPFAEIRSVSNFVEARNINNWNIPLAIKNLSIVIPEIISKLHATF
jgi:futalosine hydrolase